MAEHSSLSDKRKHLQEIAETLSAEFIGLELVIPQVLDAVTPWYLMPEWHQRPVIVNLWGMTGTGKTSLVHRLSELLGFRDKTFHVDPNAGDNTDVFSEIRNRHNHERMILVFDEFQNFRTLDDDQHETKRSKNAIWDILDNGKFQELILNYNIFELQMAVYRMRQALSMGVIVEHGQVVYQAKLFSEIIGDTWQRSDDDPIWFLPRTQWNLIGEFDNQYLIPATWKSFLISHSADEILEELDRIIAKAKRPVEIDCSRALIFVIGNLDEAYRGCGYVRRDMHADAFNALSKNIDVEQIKFALRHRFRAEQIARLGNVHILYPALSADSFYAIIDRELDRVKRHLEHTSGVQLKFDPGVRELLYKEGVYPAQGVRPLLSTIKSVLWSAVSHFAVYIRENRRKKWRLEWDSVNNQWLFISGNARFRYAYIPEARRTEKKQIYSGDRKLIAVHEAGHMLGMIVLLGEVPDQVYNNAHNGKLQGEVHQRKNETLQTMEVLINTAAMALGGWVAEGVVFGAGERTLGSYSDLEFATDLVLDALKSAGIDNNPYCMRSVVEDTNPNRVLDRSGILDTRAKEIIDTACARMTQCIHEQEELFRILVLAVEANQYLSRADIEQLLDSAGFLPQQSLAEKMALEREQAFQRMFGASNIEKAA